MKTAYKPIALAAAMLALQSCAHPDINLQPKGTVNLINQVVEQLKHNPKTGIRRYDCSIRYEWTGPVERSQLKVEYESSLKGCPPVLFGEKTLSVSHTDSTGYRKKFIDHNADGLDGLDLSARYKTTALFPGEGGYFRQFEVEKSDHMDRISEENLRKERQEYGVVLKLVLGALKGKGI